MAYNRVQRPQHHRRHRRLVRVRVAREREVVAVRVLGRALRRAVRAEGLPRAVKGAEVVRRREPARLVPDWRLRAQLLEAVGVDSVRKLKKCRPTQLYRSLVLENSQRRKRLVGRAPSAKQVGQWVKQARRLPQLVK